MKSALVRSCLGLSLVLLTAPLFAETCATAPTETQDDFSVTTPDGIYKGYVSPNANGTWFAWVSGKGASNENYTSKDDAVEYVCEAESD